jgi:hypothetical protein
MSPCRLRGKQGGLTVLADEFPMSKARCLVVVQILMWVGCTLVTAAAILFSLELKPWQSPQHSEPIYFHGGAYTDNTSDGWWNSRYTHDMEGSRRAWEDRWQIGNHTYRTSDLMGRRI